MSAPHPADPRDDALRHEQFIAEVLRIRDRKTGEKPASALPSLLSSSVVAAIITVVGTAVVGNMVTNAYQARARRNDAVLQYLRDKRAARDTAVSSALRIVGTYVTAIEDLVLITHPDFKTAGRSPAEAKKLDEWKTSLQAAHDKADDEWRRERDTTRFTLAFHDTEGGQLQAQWSRLATAVDALEDCSRGWFMQHAQGDQPFRDSPCTDQRKAVNTSMDSLVAALQEAERRFFEAQLNR